MTEYTPTMTSKLIGEFIGTFLLVFTVGCNVLSKTPVWAGVSIAAVLMVSIYSLGKISGANFNPAVSFALALSNQLKGPGMDWKTAGTFMLVQVLGGIVGAFSYAILFWDAFNLGPSKGFGALSAGLAEIFYTFMLCFVVLNVAAAKNGAGVNAEYFGLAIGFVIIAGAYGAGAVSGGAFNPAVAIGIDTSSAGLGFGWCIAYTFFEIIGSTLAVFAFKAVRPGEFANDPERPPTLSSKLISEFLGTFMLVLTVGLNVLGSSPAGAFSIAAALMCMIYALGDVSGAHFNPAVTIAIAASRLQSPDQANSPKTNALYILCQIAGGIVAGFVYAIIYHSQTFPLGPQPGFKWGQVAVAEIVFTFVLCYVVLSVAVSSKTASKTMFGLAIGSCVTVGGFAIGSISGGSLNPAVSFGIASVSPTPFLPSLTKALVYSLFECIGAGAAAVVVSTTHGRKESLGY